MEKYSGHSDSVSMATVMPIKEMQSDSSKSCTSRNNIVFGLDVSTSHFTQEHVNSGHNLNNLIDMMITYIDIFLYFVFY